MSKTEFTAEEFSALGEDTLWPRFLIFPTVALVGYIGFVMGLGGDSVAAKLLWSFGLGYCWFCISGSFHESVHQTMGKWREANIWFGRVVGTLIGVPYSAYRETHIRHHAYMNTPEDFELWPYSKPTASLAFRRFFVVFDIFGAILANPIVYGRIYFAKKSPLSAQARKTIKQEYIGIAVFWSLVLVTLTTLNMQGIIDLSKFDPMWLLPMPIAAAFNGFRKFTEHLGMASTDPILGTRTVIGNNVITRICSYFNFDLDVHGPHHRFPRAPHFQLQSKLAEYRAKYPDSVIPIFPTYLAAVMHTLPCLWRNPGVGVNAGGQPEYYLVKGVDNFVSEVGSNTANSEVRRVA
jgi:fatty acid desaturase